MNKFTQLTLLLATVAIGWGDQIEAAEGKTALLIIDVQDCFMEASGTTTGEPGSLAVGDTSEIIPIINDLRTEKACLFDMVVRTQDFHPTNHISFGPTHGLAPFAHLAGKGELPLTCVNPSSGMETDASCCPSYHIASYNCDAKLCPNMTNIEENILAETIGSPACSICSDSPEECFETTQAMWTNHCLQSGDSKFAPGIVAEDSDIIVQKGGNQFADAYSAFMDNTRKLKTNLDDILVANGVTTLYVAGIATDYCVYFSAIDALSLGYEVKVIEDATRGISEEGIIAAKEDMTKNGASIVQSSDLLAMNCPAQIEDDASSSSRKVSMLDTVGLAFATILASLVTLL